MSDDIITDPSAAASISTETPQQVLEAISEVLRKYGYAIIVPEGGKPFVLAKLVDTVRMKALAVAEVKYIDPAKFEWRALKLNAAPFLTRAVQ